MDDHVPPPAQPARIDASDDARYRLLVEAITDYAIYMLDERGYVSNWNAGARRFKGYDAAEIIGQHFSRFYTEDERAADIPARNLATAAREGRFEGEGWRLRKDGTRFWVHAIIDPIRDPSGALVGYAKITRDLTERRETRLALEHAREALFQAQKMEAIGQLTGGIAHDFNNLLMAVLGSLELLRSRVPADDKTRMLLENAFLGAQRGVALTQRMLAFARRQELALTSANLRRLVDGMSDLLQRSLGPGIAVENTIPRDLPPVKVDVNQLENALLNLAVNARDAMPAGGVIRLSAHAAEITAAAPGELPPGRYLRFAVGDTGEGMDAATLARAMEPFFTTKGAGKGAGKGTGLGLSMIHGMAEQIGGRLTLASEPGKGTSAVLWLPVAETGAGAETAPPTATPATRKALTILVVDDDLLVLVSTCAMIEQLGHKVVEAASGREALAYVANGGPLDMVVTDHAMPQMSGMQLAEAIRALKPEMPVLLVSGYAELPPGTAATLPRLTKPFSLEDLAAAVAKSAPG
ncbi:MAG: PAS domain S-box protein [Rhodospirillaceae bacterium]|nr:PAS domain S-box protein [Rhodospirillaceae bacterium]